MPNMYNDEYNMEEMYNPIDPFGLKAERELGGKRKQWMGEAACNISKFSNMETGQSSGTTKQKRQRFTLPPRCDDEVRVHEETENSTEVRGAVGPVPPLPPREYCVGTVAVLALTRQFDA